MLTTLLAVLATGVPPGFPPLFEAPPVGEDFKLGPPPALIPSALVGTCGAPIKVTTGDEYRFDTAPSGIRTRIRLRPGSTDYCTGTGTCTLRMAIVTANACQGQGPQTVQIDTPNIVRLRSYDVQGTPGGLEPVMPQGKVIGAVVKGELTIKGWPSYPGSQIDIGYLPGAQGRVRLPGDVFQVPAGQALTLEDVTFTGGDAADPAGGAVPRSTMIRADGAVTARALGFVRLLASPAIEARGALDLQGVDYRGGPPDGVLLSVLACENGPACAATRRLAGLNVRATPSLRIENRAALLVEQSANLYKGIRGARDVVLKAYPGSSLTVRNLLIENADSVEIDAGAARIDGRFFSGDARVEIERLLVDGADRFSILAAGYATHVDLSDSSLRDLGEVDLDAYGGIINTGLSLTRVRMQGRRPLPSNKKRFRLAGRSTFSLQNGRPEEAHVTIATSVLSDFDVIEAELDHDPDTPSSQSWYSTTIANAGRVKFTAAGGSMTIANTAVDAAKVRCAEPSAITRDGEERPGRVRAETAYATSTDVLGCAFGVTAPDAMLRPVTTSRNRAGPASTVRVPGPGSPLIDAGAQCGQTDILGTARPQAKRCDIGAVEVPALKRLRPLDRRFDRVLPSLR